MWNIQIPFSQDLAKNKPHRLYLLSYIGLFEKFDFIESKCWRCVSDELDENSWLFLIK